MVANREWTSHLKDESEKLDFIKIIKSSSIIRKRLEAIIESMELSLQSKQLSEDYASPVWPYLQADRLGQLRALYKVKRLLKLENDE